MLISAVRVHHSAFARFSVIPRTWRAARNTARRRHFIDRLIQVAAAHSTKNCASLQPPLSLPSERKTSASVSRKRAYCSRTWVASMVISFTLSVQPLHDESASLGVVAGTGGGGGRARARPGRLRRALWRAARQDHQDRRVARHGRAISLRAGRGRAHWMSAPLLRDRRVWCFRLRGEGTAYPVLPLSKSGFPISKISAIDNYR